MANPTMGFRFRSTLGLLAAMVLASGPSILSAHTTGLPASALPGLMPIEEVEHLVMPAVDAEALLAEDLEREGAGKPTPTRFAKRLPVSLSPNNSGTWEDLADGSRLWRLRIVSPGAFSLSLGLERFDLPAGAAFWVHDPNGAWVQGPYTKEDRNALGGLWTAVVAGHELVAELHLPRGDNQAEIEITSVNHDYRGFGENRGELSKDRGSCHVNVACPEGNRFADQIRSVARITFVSGVYTFLCTAQLINNTAEDDTPYLLTAEYCVSEPEVAPTIVAYWNYETAACDESSGGNLSQNQSGATLIASSPSSSGSDFALIELDQPPDPSFDVFFVGWDAREAPPESSVCIHHPDGDLKSISFDEDPATVTSRLENASPGTGDYLRVGDWDLGSTEPGSTGACLLDETSGLCVGTLSGFYARCGNDDPAWFGRLHRQYTGEGTPETRLSDWLDPLGTGAQTLFGKNPGTKPASQTWLIPSVASLTGAGGSDWKSQVSLANASASSRNAMIYYVPKGDVWPGELLGGPLLIGPMGSLYLDDPLLPERPTAGVMYLTADGDNTVAFSRTINLTESGATLGQGMPGVLLNDARLTTELVLPMVHSSPGRYRTNVGFAQTSSGNFRVKVSVYTSEGVLLAEHTYVIKTAWRQVDDIFRKLGVGDLDVEGGWIRVVLVGGSPAFWTTYATVIDSRTNDPTYVLAVEP
jgi:hypothetical protein